MEEKKKEETTEEDLTEPFFEALLEYQIHLKEETIDQVLLALKQVEEKNKEYQAKNDHVKNEQQARIRRILRKLEEEEKEEDKKEIVNRDDVEESLKAKWQYIREQEQLLKDLRLQIEVTDQKLLVKRAERDYWLEYKNVGSKIQADKIENLEKDIKEVKDDFCRATEYYTNALKALKEQNDNLIETQMKKSKEQAPEKAVKRIDKSSCRDIAENEWLKEEIKIYREEISVLKASIYRLEEENIGLVMKLLDLRLQNLRVPRHLFLTQAAGLQNGLPEDGIKRLEHGEHEEAKTDGDESSRNASVPHQKEKDFSKFPSETGNERTQESYEGLWEDPFAPTLSSLLYEDEKDFQEYLKLGPLETKLMCVVGRAMPIHKESREMPSKSRFEEGFMSKSGKHITAQMIKSLSKEKIG